MASSIDIAVCISSQGFTGQSSACFALDRVVFELVLELARPDGPCRSLQLTKHAFCGYNAATDDKYASHNLLRDEVMCQLVWVDNLVSSLSAHLEQARQKLFLSDKHSALEVSDAFRSMWLQDLEAKIPPN
jgi:hypothetical protein